MPRIIFIDAVNQTVSELDKKLTFKEFYKLVNTDLLEAGVVDAQYFTGHSLYVDEEGLLKNAKHFFSIKGAYQPFAGSGVITGYNSTTGGEKAATISLDEVKKNVRFFTMDEEVLND